MHDEDTFLRNAHEKAARENRGRLGAHLCGFTPYGGSTDSVQVRPVRRRWKSHASACPALAGDDTGGRRRYKAAPSILRSTAWPSSAPFRSSSRTPRVAT